MRFRLAVLTGLCLTCLALEIQAGEAPATPEQVAALVKQLGADDFDAREKAEVALAKVGTAALAELQKAAQSNDPEIRTRSARLLEQLKWTVLPKITDLASVLPPDNILFIGTPNMKDLVARLRKETVLGRLYDHSGLVPLRDALWELGLKGAGWDDDGRKLADQWLDHFGGPYGFAFIKHDPQKDWSERDQIAFFTGITGANPKDEMAAFQKRFPQNGNAVPQLYRGVTCSFIDQGWRKDGQAMAKNLIVRSNGKASMFTVIDALIDEGHPDLAGSAAYKEARSKVSGEALATLFFDMQSLAEKVFSRERDRNIATGLGFMEWKYAIVTLGVKDDLVVEQAFCKVEGQRRGMAQLLSLEPVTGRLASLCPPDALLFVSIPADGKAILDRILTMVETVEPRAGKDFRDRMTAFDQQLNLNVMETLAGAVKGEAALWLLRPQGPDLTKFPATCLALEALDAGAATKAADTLAKLLPLLAGKDDLVGKAEYQGRTCYFMKPQEGRERWEPELLWSWCADGARILIGQRQEVLQQMLLRSTQKAKGLDTRPDFQKLLAAIPQDERGGLAYANASEVLMWACAAGLPALSVDAPEDVKAMLAQAPKDPQSLFKDFPGTLLSIRGTPDGVRARAVGSIPATAWTITAPVAFFYKMQMDMRAEMQKQQAKAAAAAAAEQKAKEKELDAAQKAAREAAEKKAEEKKAQPAAK